MTCYNLVIRYYEKKGYELEVQNLQAGKFKFKCSPTGLLKNFSYFKATKKGDHGIDEVVYIFHNATAQSAFEQKGFTLPGGWSCGHHISAGKGGYYISKKTCRIFF